MEKIRLRTSGVPLDGRRAAPPDMDHAVKILDMARRGYTVSASSEETYGWYVGVYYSPDRLFVNQPEGTTSTLMVKTTHHNEDARLTDGDWPEWVTTLLRLLKTAAPPTMYVRTGVTDKEQEDG